MMFGLIPGLNPGLPVYAASGTVTFSAANRTNLGQTIHDGDWGSTDIPGIQLDIFNANTGAPSTAVGSFPYFTAAELWDTTFGGIAPIDTTSGYVVSDSSNVNITPKIIVIKSNNGAEFQFKGFYAVDYQIRQLQMTVEGFRDGSSTGFVTLNTDDSVGITYTTSDLTPAKFQNVDEIRITNFSGAGNWVAINNIVIGDPVGSNTAPTFVGATTTLTVNQNAAATDIKGLLHASDSDSGQTLTWSQNAAPSHGTLSFSSATASSGSTDITPGGTITYTPTSGYAGSDSFTVRVSDGTATATRTITVTVNDVTAPTLTAGAVNRTSDTAGTVKFTSDEAGQYYYSVVADGAAAPTIDTSGAGTACTTSETTITNPTGLTAGAKDIYIKVKDASGNVSDVIKIDIAAYVAPDITAPILTAGAVNRTSDTEGTIKFTSDEAGQYYYSVVADGAAAPTIDTSGAGTACTTSETTITNPTGLTAGAKDIYIKVKDASGNVSDAIKIDITAYVAPDITAPILTAGAVNRTSDTAGTVKFTSDEAGQYYYSVVTDGAAIPTIDTSGAGTACTTSETTITNPTGLTAGAKDIYIKVKDASGNVSDAIKIDIAAYVAADITAPILTAGAVNRTSDTEGTIKFTSDEAGQYYYSVVADGAAAPTIDTSGAGTACTTAETTITNPTGLTAGAKDIYIKVKDASGNVSDVMKIDIAAYVAPDITAPILTAGAVNRTSDTEGTIKFTSDEAGQYYYSVVADGAAAPTIDTSGAGTSCTTSETTITNPTGLTAGAKDIYLKVKDASGNVSDAIKIDIAAYVAPSGDSGSGSSSGNNGGSGTTTPSQPSQGSVIVIVNGIEQNAGTETKTTEGGQSVVTVAVNNTVIESKINDAIKNNPTGTGNIIQVPVTDTKSDVVKVELTGDIIKKLEDNNFQVSVKRDAVEYILPAEELTIGKIAESLGVKLEDLKDIKTEVKIAKLDQAVVDRYNTVAKESGAELIFAPVAFEIVAKTTKADGTTSNVQISKFSNYVERIMEIPAGVDPSKITTGIVFNPDGTYSHVPTEVFQRDGKWYARLNSLTNSNYSVVWNPVTVKSVEKHWAKDAVNDMASRLVIFNPESFDPNKAITRADFAEYIVRALGLYRVGSTHDNKFKDVSATGDRTLAILIASEYGIVTGYPDGTFRSDALITREEAMTMYQRAMKVTKLVGKDDDRYQNFTDYKQVGSWATSYVQAVLSAHVFNGTTATTISPKSNLTYAEAAQAIKNLLVESKLINK